MFLIDEVHMLSNSSFNALLKSIEEPPAHVVFMMATTALDKIPDTVLSRSQVYEFRTISSKTVAERLRYVAGQEGITVPDDALLLLARAGEGSMRDSLSAFDQVRAFAGDTLTLDDVTSVLGLVGRDLVFDVLDAVADEDAAAAFALVDTAIERGYDLRLLCRELARATRDLLVVSVDGGRLKDPDVAERVGARAAGGDWRPLLARRPAARLRRLHQGRIRRPAVGPSALPARDGAAAPDAPAQAGAAGRAARRRAARAVGLASRTWSAPGRAAARRSADAAAGASGRAPAPPMRSPAWRPRSARTAGCRSAAPAPSPAAAVEPWRSAAGYGAREATWPPSRRARSSSSTPVVAQAYQHRGHAGADHLCVPAQAEGAAGAVRGEPRVAESLAQQ